MTTESINCLQTFRVLESERAQLIEHLADWPTECVHFRATPSTWSAPEVLDHIVRAECGTIADLRAGLRSPRMLGTEERPKVAVLERLLRSEQHFKVPASAAAIHPDSQTTLPEVVNRWENARIELRSLLEEFAPVDAYCGVFFHPFAGWMTFREVLEHFSSHIYHHRFQLQRLRTSWLELST